MLQFIGFGGNNGGGYVGFNTSHVVVYQDMDDFEEEAWACFNTSHVVVYPSHHTLLM